MMQEQCVTCGNDLVPGRYFICDERGGPFCGECFVAVKCFELHGEGCATMVFDDGKDAQP